MEQAGLRSMRVQVMGERRWWRSEHLKDLSLLVVVGWASVMVYVTGLGFYSDDWFFFERFSLAEGEGLIDLFRAGITPNTFMRPVQVFYLALLYKIFGFNPLPYHLINATVLIGGGLFFYLTLRKLTVGRLAALGAALVFLTLPHYSTDRFWYSAFQANLCMACYFLSLFADVNALYGGGWRRGLWKVASLMSIVVGTLAYEVFLPLFLLNPLVVWWFGRKEGLLRTNGARKWRERFALFGSNVLTVFLVALFKASVTVRRPTELDEMPAQIRWFARFLVKAFRTTFGTYGVDLPVIWKRILTSYFDERLLAVAIGVMGMVFVYLFFVRGKVAASFGNRRSWLFLFGVGLFFFVAGYSLFVTNRFGMITPTGIGNRVAIAAAVGVALAWAGGIGLFASIVRGTMRHVVYAGLVAFLVGSGVLINGTLGRFWVEAYQKEQTVLARIEQRFPTWPDGAALILDGVCPYVGPAIVFESNWDLAGALRVHYHDPAIRADVVTRNLSVDEEGVSTLLYGHIKARYPYGESLLLYNFAQDRLYRLNSAASAQAYFEAHPPGVSNGCPFGLEGYGVRVY